MKILAVDVSGKSLSVALLEDERPLTEATLNVGYTHSHTLMPALEWILTQSHCSLQAVDLLAVTVGPGSFTGIRIGLSSLKTLAWQSNKPLIPVSSLEAMAYPWRSAQAWVIPTIDARGDRLFSAAYSSGETILTESNRPVSDLMEDLRVLAAKRGMSASTQQRSEKIRLLLLGDGSPILSDRLQDAVEQMESEASKQCGGSDCLWEPVILDPNPTCLKASSVGRLALARYQEGCLGNWQEAEPHYLSLSQPERLSQEAQKKSKIQEG